MSNAIPPTPEPLSYASPRSRATPVRSGILGGVVLLAAGLVLIGLGGCFLIGVVDLSTSPAVTNYGSSMQNWPLALAVMPWVLYLLAFACFAGAIWMIAAGVRWLYSV